MAGDGLSPLSSIPERGSSKQIFQGSSDLSMRSAASRAPPPLPSHGTTNNGTTVPARGRSSSPIRRPNVLTLRRAPSRTFAPSVMPTDLLDTPRLTHSRLKLAIHLSGPIFMGGATVEGEIHVGIDGGPFETRRKSTPSLSLSKISTTLVGIERCKGRQDMFRALSSDLIDAAHPPPASMAPDSGHDATWGVQPSNSTLPFRLNLPVVMGPPPYRSKKAGISYWLSTLAEFRISGKKHFVRQSREVTVLTVHDPEKALVNLSSPLLAVDEMPMSKRHSTQTVKLTAGLHRQTWISGYLVFVDMHIDNKSSKDVKKVELQLEKTTLFHNYPAPSTSSGSADVLRLPDHRQTEIVVRKELADGFKGVHSLSQDFRTCQLELPTGLVSIETGRFFGIRYFLNIQITCSLNKHLKVQLPITIIHPNSIDIPPNAVAQVAASIEHKHRNHASTSGTGSPYRYRAGQAFKAARRQSYLQLRKDTVGSTEMEELTRALEGSPRRMALRLGDSPRKTKVARRQSAKVLGSSTRNTYQHLLPRSSFDTTTNTKYSMPRSSYETLRPVEQRGSPQRRVSRGPRSSLETKVLKGLRGSFETSGPRLQRSTSGLAFDESEKENYAPK